MKGVWMGLSVGEHGGDSETGNAQVYLWGRLESFGKDPRIRGILT
jgi:hypothetical protein